MQLAGMRPCRCFQAAAAWTWVRSSRAGTVVWAVDNEHWAVETYRRNLGRHIVEADITSSGVPDVPCDILLAGPPCQDYSTLWNHDGLKTARGNLFRQVPGSWTSCGPRPSCWRTCRGCCRRTGHSLDAGPARAAVPASFVRRAPAGVRYDSQRPGGGHGRPRRAPAPGAPDRRRRPAGPGGAAAGDPDAVRRQPVTVGDALDRNPLLARRARTTSVGLDSRRRGRAAQADPPGRNYEVIPKGHPLAVSGLISHVYRRLDPDKPAYTMIAGGGGGTHGYHHREPRRLSNREKARLQGFPDDFVFEPARGPGRRDVRSAYPRVRRQIGNAVPPPAAKVIVAALADALAAAGVPHAHRRRAGRCPARREGPVPWRSTAPALQRRAAEAVR